jgi:citrate lyase subunit beta/citryl-CoA lyase
MPINNPRFVASAWTRQADSLDFDLEDSVPQAQKEQARSVVRETLPLGAQGGARVQIRINVASVEADLAASVWPGLNGIILPKAETGDQVRAADAEIGRLERLRGLRAGTVELSTLIETPKGVTNCYEIASASPRIRAFSGGGGYDMSLELGIEMFQDFDQFFYPRSECALAARALGLQPGIAATRVGPPDTSGSVSDGERARLQAEANRKLGGRSGGGLHPNVVVPQNDGLTPTADEVEDARRVLAFFREMDERGDAEGLLDGQVIDRYEAARADELLEWAAACAEMDAYKARRVAETEARLRADGDERR